MRVYRADNPRIIVKKSKKIQKGAKHQLLHFD